MFGQKGQSHVAFPTISRYDNCYESLKTVVKEFYKQIIAKNPNNLPT